MLIFCKTCAKSLYKNYRFCKIIDLRPDFFSAQFYLRTLSGTQKKMGAQNKIARPIKK